MIVDTLSGSGRYDALHPRFKKAFDYAVARMDTLAPGKYAIDGDDLYIVISEGLLRPEQPFADYDIQIVSVDGVFPGSQRIHSGDGIIESFFEPGMQGVVPPRS